MCLFASSNEAIHSVWRSRVKAISIIHEALIKLLCRFVEDFAGTRHVN